MTNTIMTTNERVQSFITYGELRPSKKRKFERMQEMKSDIEANGLYFDEVFNGSAQCRVIDEILYLLSSNGIWKISAPVLAQRATTSTRTVHTVVSKLKAYK